MYIAVPTEAKKQYRLRNGLAMTRDVDITHFTVACTDPSPACSHFEDSAVGLIRLLSLAVPHRYTEETGIRVVRILSTKSTSAIAATIVHRRW